MMVCKLKVFENHWSMAGLSETCTGEHFNSVLFSPRSPMSARRERPGQSQNEVNIKTEGAGPGQLVLHKQINQKWLQTHIFLS